MKTVILANGEFPKKGGEPWKLLESAKRIVACDGAANAFIRRFRRVPDFIVGDLDSYTPPERNPSAPAREIVSIADQSDNDLAKAITFCRSHGWNDLVIVGATGRREDHSLGNIFRAMEAGIEVVTDCGRFLPVERRFRARVGKGAPVSVFAIWRDTMMTSRGLEWPLDGVRFQNLYCATLNRASAAVVTIDATRPFFVYLPTV